MGELTVSASELARNTSALLDEVDMGRVIVVQRRGRPVARLIPESRAGRSILGRLKGRGRQLVDDDTLLAPIGEWDAQ